MQRAQAMLNQKLFPSSGHDTPKEVEDNKSLQFCKPCTTGRAGQYPLAAPIQGGMLVGQAGPAWQLDRRKAFSTVQGVKMLD